ncbi:MAG: hypothetical protein ACOYNF_15080 [Rhodoferax sp.]
MQHRAQVRQHLAQVGAPGRSSLRELVRVIGRDQLIRLFFGGGK